jgi:hypothetical protein
MNVMLNEVKPLVLLSWNFFLAKNEILRRFASQE